MAVTLTCAASTVSAENVAPPASAPAAARWDATTGRLTLEYHGTTILSATVTAKDADGNGVAVGFDSKAETADEKVEQRLIFTPAEAKEGTTLVLAGTVTGSVRFARQERRPAA